MTSKTKIKLYDNAINWVFTHCEDEIAYAYALKEIGYPMGMVASELKESYELDTTRIKQILREVGLVK